jgi:hypothetical protein
VSPNGRIAQLNRPGFAAVHESAYGTSRHFAALQNLSAIGVTADMPNGFSEVKSSKRELPFCPVLTA